jgi:hypothetical protein
MKRFTFLLILFGAQVLLPQQITLPCKSDSVRFAAIGDTGTGERPQYEVAEQMIRFHQKFPFTFTIMLGDNIYGGESSKKLIKKFEAPYKPLMDDGVNFYAALGNHDEDNQRFYKLFGMNGKRFYSFKKGNAHFFALDTNYLDPEQLTWLEKELSKVKFGWKICFFHHPLYSSGKFHGSSTELRSVLEPIFVKHGVNVVFSGHEHVYERIKPQKGIYYFTEGASGKLRLGNLGRTNFMAAGYDRDQTFMLIEIVDDELYFQTVSRTGITVDTGVIRRAMPGESAVIDAHPSKGPVNRAKNNNPDGANRTGTNESAGRAKNAQ